MSEIDVFSTKLEKVKVNFREIAFSEEGREIRAFLTSQFISFLVFMALRQIFPLYLQTKTGLPWEDIAIRWSVIMMVYTLGGILTRIPIGYLMEKFGRKIMIVSSYLLLIVSVGALAFTESTVWLAIIWVFIRVTNNTFGLSGRSLLSDIESKYKGLYNSLISTAGRSGSLIGTIVLGVILDIFKPQIMLICAVALAIFGLIIFLLVFRRGKGEKRHEMRRNDQKNGLKRKFNYSYLKSKVFIFFAIAFLVFGLMEGVTSPLFSIYGKNDLGLSSSLVGTIIGLSNLSFIIFGPIIGIIISRKPKSNNYLLLTSSIIVFVNYLIFYFLAENIFVFALFLVIRNLAQAMFFPVSMTILTSKLPKDFFAVLYSIVTTAFFLGNVGTNYLGGLIYNQNHVLPWLYSFLISITLIGVVVFYILSTNREKKNKI
ncbi:MAG: MFS transporter [Candidatus Heimdallarchaeaceae archaeon]